MSFASSGADYLGRLREDLEHPRVSPPATATPIAAEPMAPEAGETPGEGRRSPRYKCEGSAEFRVGGIDVRTWGTFTDLILNGCYVEMTATFSGWIRRRSGAGIEGNPGTGFGRSPGELSVLGMSIAFREVLVEDRRRLEEMVEQLNPLRAVKRTPEAEEMRPAGASLPVVLDSGAALRALTEFFDTRGPMSKEEFIRVLRRSQGV